MTHAFLGLFMSCTPQNFEKKARGIRNNVNNNKNNVLCKSFTMSLSFVDIPCNGDVILMLVVPCMCFFFRYLQL